MASAIVILKLFTKLYLKLVYQILGIYILTIFVQDMKMINIPGQERKIIHFDNFLFNLATMYMAINYSEYYSNVFPI